MKAIKRYVYLFRHGKTELGKEKRFLGHIDCNLSEEGKQKIGKIAQAFLEKNLFIKHIFSSDLKRCRETIQIIFPQREITFLKDLREINMGDWDGLTFDEVKLKYPNEFQKRGENIADFCVPHGESFRDFQIRAVKVFYDIVRNTEGNVAICSHAGFNRALLCYFLKKDLKDIFDIKQDYGCLNILSIDEDNIVVCGINLKDDFIL